MRGSFREGRRESLLSMLQLSAQIKFTHVKPHRPILPLGSRPANSFALEGEIGAMSNCTSDAVSAENWPRMLRTGRG